MKSSYLAIGALALVGLILLERNRQTALTNGGINFSAPPGSTAANVTGYIGAGSQLIGDIKGLFSNPSAGAASSVDTSGGGDIFAGSLSANDAWASGDFSAANTA